jgi:hypothetical protein
MTGLVTADQRLRDLLALRAQVDREIAATKERLDVDRPRVRRSRHVQPPCGTPEGYQWHRYNQPDQWPLPKSDPCGCRAAHAADQRVRDQLRRITERRERWAA